MASNQAVWGIEIGQCALKAIRLAVNGETGNVEALAFDYIEHPKILSQPDADPEALSREAIRTFLSRNSVKGDRICIGVPGQSGLARFIKLPPVEQSRIPEIVKYEARQQIPFALEEVVWDFQKIGQAEEAEGFALETEIGLFAMKRDLIYRFLNPFHEVGVEVNIVQMRPLAVYNFAGFDQMGPKAEAGEEKGKEESEYQREELIEGKKEVADDSAGGFVVLLDMGADYSDLVITDGTRIWQRNLPIGGNHFTRALTKELKLTFAKAEHLKRNATKAQDPRAIFQAMRPVFNDLVSEIQRSIGYFSSVHRQSKVTKIIGMGNAFKLPGLQKFLGQNLQFPVEKVENFIRLKGDQVLSAPAFQENVLSFSVVYGLALQGLGVSGIRTNLLPPEISQARMIRRKKPWALSAAAMLMAAFTCLFFGNWSQLNAVKSPAFGPAEARADSAEKTQQAKKSAYDQVLGEWTLVKRNGETLTGNVDKRLEWIEVLEVIDKALPDNPANVDRKKLKELGEVHITAVRVRLLDDVKTEWYDRVLSDPTQWPKSTILPLDEKELPTGLGWLFTLDGYHFNKGQQIYSSDALLDPFKGFHSPLVREVGIKCAVLISNWVQRDYIPGTDEKSSRSRASTVGVGGGTPGGAGGGNALSRMMGGGAMGGGMGAADPGGGSGGGGEPGGRGGRSGMGGAGAAESIPQPGGPGIPLQAGDAGESSRITVLPRTNFQLEFIWQPIEKSKRTKTREDWAVAIKNYGLRQRDFNEALLKQEGPPISLIGTDVPQSPSPLPGVPGQPVQAQPLTTLPAVAPGTTAPTTAVSPINPLGGTQSPPNQPPAK